MSRFDGWKSKKDYPGMLIKGLKAIAPEIPCTREYVFHGVRKFRIDIAMIDVKLSVEFDGGIWNGGRHVRGAGIKSDHKKRNLLAQGGWTCLYYTTDDVKDEHTYWATVHEIREMYQDIKTGRKNEQRII